METTTRTLTTDEREALASRRAALEARLAADAIASEKARRGAFFALLVFPAVFGAIAVYDVIVGALPAALAAGVGTLAFLAIALWVGRRDPTYPSERRAEIDRLADALREDRVLVHDIAADAAILICQRGDEDNVIGDVLRINDRELVYVSRSRTAAIDPARLPNDRLHIAWIPPLGVIAAEARGERLTSVERVALDSEDDIYEHVWAELTAFEIDFETLRRTLAPTPARPPYR